MIEYIELNNNDKIEIINSYILSNQNMIYRYQHKLNNFTSLDKSLLENKLSEQGLSDEIKRLNEVVTILYNYKQTLI